MVVARPLLFIQSSRRGSTNLIIDRARPLRQLVHLSIVIWIFHCTYFLTWALGFELVKALGGLSGVPLNSTSGLNAAG